MSQTDVVTNDKVTKPRNCSNCDCKHQYVRCPYYRRCCQKKCKRPGIHELVLCNDCLCGCYTDPKQHKLTDNEKRDPEFSRDGGFPKVDGRKNKTKCGTITKCEICQGNAIVAVDAKTTSSIVMFRHNPYSLCTEHVNERYGVDRSQSEQSVMQNHLPEVPPPILRSDVAYQPSVADFDWFIHEFLHKGTPPGAEPIQDDALSLFSFDNNDDFMKEFNTPRDPVVSTPPSMPSSSDTSEFNWDNLDDLDIFQSPPQQSPIPEPITSEFNWDYLPPPEPNNSCNNCHKGIAILSDDLLNWSCSYCKQDFVFPPIIPSEMDIEGDDEFLRSLDYSLLHSNIEYDMDLVI